MKCDNCKNKDISIRVDIKCSYMQEMNCEGGINRNNIFSTKLCDFKVPSYL